MACLWVTLLGGPGAGKTTVGQTLESGDYPQLGEVRYISGSLLLNDYIAARRHGWRELEKAKASGKLADQGFIHELLEERIEGLSDADVVLLDGLPKSLDQVEMTDKLSPSGHVDLAIFLDCDATQRVARIAGRVVCDTCKQVLNHDDEGEPVELRCQAAACGGNLIRRNDDDPGVVEYREESGEPVELLVSYYAAAGRLDEIDATRAPDVVAAEIVAAIERCRDRTSAQNPG